MIRNRLSKQEYIDGILNDDKIVLGQAITLTESSNSNDQQLAMEVMEAVITNSGKSIRVGITGIPGVGKSTFIESFGSYLAEELRKKVAVLAVDPSSKVSKGSILGDKTRMERLAGLENAFIRPSPTGNMLGGIAQRSREVMLLCEAAGYEVLIIETVGVGQSETSVRELVDFFLLLMIPGAGDDLQGIKRGILEMADLVAINKSDGDNLQIAEEACKQLTMALHLYPPPVAGFQTRVLMCSALKNTGIKEIWSEIEKYLVTTKKSGYFQTNRKSQNLHWMNQYVADSLTYRFYNKPETKKMLKKLKKQLENGEVSPLQAGKLLLDVS